MGARDDLLMAFLQRPDAGFGPMSDREQTALTLELSAKLKAADLDGRTASKSWIALALGAP